MITSKHHGMCGGSYMEEKDVGVTIRESVTSECYKNIQVFPRNVNFSQVVPCIFIFLMV